METFYTISDKNENYYYYRPCPNKNFIENQSSNRRKSCVFKYKWIRSLYQVCIKFVSSLIASLIASLTINFLLFFSKGGWKVYIFGAFPHLPGPKKKKKSKRAKTSKTAVKVQVGALVKRRMRVTIDNRVQMAVVFGTVKWRFWGKWQILFQNGHCSRLTCKEFEVVLNDSSQKQIERNANNEISLVTPIENNVIDVRKKMPILRVLIWKKI